MSLELSLLRWKPWQKARHEPQNQFYALCDNIFRADTLETAWKLVEANKGSAGGDESRLRTSNGGRTGLQDS